MKSTQISFMRAFKLFLTFVYVVFVVSSLTANEGKLDSIRVLIDLETDVEKKYNLYTQYIKELEKTDRSETVPYNHKRLDIAQALSDPTKIAECFRSLGQNYLFVNNNDSAHYYLKLALPIYEESRDTGMMTTVLNNVALIHQRSNNYEKATKTYHEVIENSYKIKKYNVAIGALINVASLQINQSNAELAIDYLLRAEEVYNEIPKDSLKVLKLIEEFYLPSLFVNLGVAYEKKQPKNSSQLYIFGGDNYLDSSTIYFNKTINATEDIDNKYNATYIKSYALENMAAINYHKEEWNEAYVNYKLALDGFEEIKNNQGAVFSKVDIGDVLTKLGRYKEAEVYLLDGLEGAIEFNITEEIRDAYKNLAENAKARNDFKSSMMYLESHGSFKDSLMNKDRINAIQEMETKYETDRIEQEKILAEKDAAISEQKNQQQRVFFLLGLMGVVGISALGYSRYRLKQQRKAAKYERSLNVAMSKFVPTEFIESIGRKNITDVQLGDMKEKEVTVVFTDIRNFTSRSEKMTPTELFQFVRDYAQAMGPIIRKNSGFINQYLGDGLMAIFQNDSQDALNACIEMHERLKSYNDELDLRGVEKIQVGMALHTGPAVMGIIGDEDRKDAAMLSDTINTAARMEGKTKQYGVKILISEESKARLNNLEGYLLRNVGSVNVKGKEKSIDIYECYNPDDEKTLKIKMATIDKFDQAVDAFMNQKYGEAHVMFKDIVDKNPDDLVSKSFVSQIGELIGEVKKTQ